MITNERGWVGEEQPVVRQSSRTLAEVLQGGSVDKRGGWVERGLLTHLGAGGRVGWSGVGELLTSGQSCKSWKPRRWPWSKACLVNHSDFWRKMKYSNREARTTSFHFFLWLFGRAPQLQSTSLGSSTLTRESWTQISGHRAQQKSTKWREKAGSTVCVLFPGVNEQKQSEPILMQSRYFTGTSVVTFDYGGNVTSWSRGNDKNKKQGESPINGLPGQKCFSTRQILHGEV